MIARPGQLALLTFALLFALGRGALGAESAPPLRLVLQSDGPGILDAQTVRAMVEAELGRPTFLDRQAATAGDGPTLTIVYRSAGNELTVSYLVPPGEPVIRTVSAPATGAEVAPLAVLLAGNVARDQTTELLDVPASRPEPTADLAPPVEVSTGTSSHGDLSARLLWLAKRTRPLVWTETLSLLNLGAEVGWRSFYAQLGASYHPDDGYGRALVGPAVAVGARRPLPNLPLAGEADLAFIYFRGIGAPDAPSPYTVVYTATRLVSRLRVALVYTARPRLDVFAGAALSLTTHFYEVPSNDFGPELFGGIRL